MFNDQNSELEFRSSKPIKTYQENHIHVWFFEFRSRAAQALAPRVEIYLACDELSRVEFGFCGLEFPACPPLALGGYPDQNWDLCLLKSMRT